MITIKKTALNSIIKNKKSKSKSPKEKMDFVLNNFNNKNNDYAYYNKNQFVIVLKNIRLITNNDLLRIDSRKITPYKKYCKERISNSIKDIDIKEWQENTKNKKLKLEYIYMPSHGKKMDNIDGIVGAFKFLIDGLTLSKIIKDDSEKYIPLAFPKQKKGNDEIYILLTIENNEEKYYSKEFKNLIKKNLIKS